MLVLGFVVRPDSGFGEARYALRLRWLAWLSTRNSRAPFSGACGAKQAMSEQEQPGENGGRKQALDKPYIAIEKALVFLRDQVEHHQDRR